MQTLKLILQTIIRGRLYSLVSIAGLTVAIAGFVLVAALIRQETSFEDMFTNADSIYRLTWENPRTGDRFATMFNPSSPQMAKELPEIKEATRITTATLLFKKPAEGDDPALLNLEDMAFADPNFFEIFNFDFEEGDASTALVQPGSMVLTRAAARKYFGDEDPMGKTLLLEDKVALTVRGVIADMPKTTHFSSHFYVQMETMRPIYGGAKFLDFWGSDSLYHYVVLADGADPRQLEAQLPDFAKRHSGWDNFNAIINLQPLKSIHFTNDLQDEEPFTDSIKNITKTPRKKSDLVLFSVGILVLLLIASFNFMNLQIARSISKNRQLGLLRIFGAGRRKITLFILAESLVLSVFALVVALVLVNFSLNGFSSLLGTDLTWAGIMTPKIIAMTIGLTIGLSLVSSAYPAVLMSSLVPSRVLKGEITPGKGTKSVRHTLVLLQFAVSVILIIVSFGIYSQVRYALTVPLGFDDQNVLVIEGNRKAARDAFPTLKARFLENSDISYVARGRVAPPGNLSDGIEFIPEGGDPKSPVGARMVGVDYDYFEALGMPFLAGRSFREQSPADIFVFPTKEDPNTTGGIILNETAARRAGWTDPIDAIGKTVTSEYDLGDGPFRTVFTVVGVVPDIHFKSLRSDVSPVAFTLGLGGSTFIVKFAHNDHSAAMTNLQKVWNETVPETPLSATFLSDKVASLYGPERKTLNLLSVISLLAIFVAALGLFAVAKLVSQAKTKEIGIRKVFGATIRKVVNLLSWQFLKPVLFANLLAWPIAWFFLNDWLKGFAYRFEITVFHFLVPAVAVLLIAWGTVAGQAWKVAHTRPVKALRYE